MQVFKNATFISCEDDNRVFSVLVEDRGRIVFTGDAVPEEYNGAKSVDLGGACVVPGFADTHMHFESFSLFRSTVDVRDAGDFNELGDIINRYEKNHPDEKLIIGFGCSAHIVKEKRLPERADLDRITSTPIIITKYDGHAAVANSALINMLPQAVLENPGFNRNTGWLYQTAFFEGINYITKSVPPVRVLKNLVTGADFLARNGITLVHTVEGVGYKNDLDVDTMLTASRALPQTFRVYFQTLDVDKVVRRKLLRVGGCFAAALDGCFGSEDAALKSPYSNNPNNNGVLFYTQERVNDFVKEANRKGLQVSMHAIGDAAVEQAITAYENALSDFPRNDHRHIIIHSDLIPAPLMERAAKLGLHLAVQPPFLNWPQEPMEYISRILGDRADNLIPLRSMIEHGMIIAGGSDAPCTVPNPIEGIYAACNHPNTDQRISVIDALRMYTNWAARLSFDEKERGTLTPGKAADFAVLDKNPLSVPAAALKDIKVKDTYIDGEKYSNTIKGPVDLMFKAYKSKLLNRSFRY